MLNAIHIPSIYNIYFYFLVKAFRRKGIGMNNCTQLYGVHFYNNILQLNLSGVPTGICIAE